MNEPVQNGRVENNQPVSVENLFRFPSHAVPAFYLLDYLPWMGFKPQMVLSMNEKMAQEIHDLILECVEPDRSGQDNHLLALARRIENFFTHRNYHMDALRQPPEVASPPRRRFNRTGNPPVGG